MTIRKSAAAIAGAVRLTWLVGMLLVVATATLLAPVLHHDFVIWDDGLHLSDNPFFQPVTWAHVGEFWRAPYERLYIPVTYTVWAAVVWWSQTMWPGPLKPGLFHGLNLLLHLGNVLIVYRLGVLMLPPGEAGRGQRQVLAAAAGAALFGLHPLQVEAVAWVSGLKDILCGWWALAAIWQYAAYVQAPSGHRRALHYGLASGAFVLALLSKPAAVVVPAVAGLVAVAGLGQPWGHAARALGGWLGAALLCGFLTKGQQLDAAMAFLPPLWARPAIVADSLSFYLGKLAWPVDLGPDYGRTPPLVLAQGGQYLPALGLLVLGGTLWRVRVRYRELWLAMGVFVASLLPVLGGVSFLFQEHSTVADRYTYLALLGPALGFAGWLRRPRRWWSWGVAGLLVLALCGWRSAAQVRVWQNTATLFTHALRINPLSAPSHNNLGWALARQGQLDRAVAHFMQALQLKPLMLEAHYNLGDALADKGQLDDAVAHYTWVVQRKPTWFEAHNNLAGALLRQDRLDDAMAHYLQAQQLKPHWSLPYNNVGNVLFKQGKLQEAIPWFTRAAQLTPVLPEAPYNLGGVWQQQGRYAEAIMAYREALRRRPHWPQANVQLARVLLSQAPLTPQEIAEAVALAERACQASDYRHAIPLRTLAAAYYAARQQAAAVRTARQALDMARTTGDPALVAEITAQLQQYERTQSSQTLPADTPQAP